MTRPSEAANNYEMSGFNTSSGTIGGPDAGGTQGFNRTGSGIQQYPNQPIDEVFGKLHKVAGQTGNSQVLSEVTNLLNPVYDILQKARSKHREASKAIVDKAWETAKEVSSLIQDNWDKAL